MQFQLIIVISVCDNVLDLWQNQREVTLAGFRSGKFPVLVATDVAARGLDISGVELVVQCEPPKDPETYIHRSGTHAVMTCSAARYHLQCQPC